MEVHFTISFAIGRECGCCARSRRCTLRCACGSTARVLAATKLVGAYAAPAVLLLARLTASQVAWCSRCVIPRAFPSQRPCCDARPPPRGVHSLTNNYKKKHHENMQSTKNETNIQKQIQNSDIYTWCDWVCQVQARCCVIAHRSRSEACSRRPPQIVVRRSCPRCEPAQIQQKT